MSKKITYILIFSLAISIQLFLWPLLITNDGTTYISSGYSLFTQFEATHYYWIREPGYPLFLRLLPLGSPFGIILLVAIQTIFIYGAVFIIFEVAARFFKIEIKNSYLLFLFIIILFIFQYSIYASIALQQAMFAFIGAIYTLILYLIWNTNTLKNYFIYVLLFLLLNLFTTNLIVFFVYIPMVLAVSIAVRLYFVLNDKSLLLKTSSALLLFTFLIICQFAFTQPWQIYKNSALSSATTTESSIEESSIIPTETISPQPSLQPVPDSTSENIVPDNFRTTKLPNVTTVFNSYRKEFRWNFLEFFQFAEDPYIKNENLFFINTMNENRGNCFFVISSQWYPFYDSTLKILSSKCILKPTTSQLLTQGLDKSILVSQEVFNALSNVFLFIFLLLTLIGKFNFLLVFAYPITFITVYILSANTLDRYTIGVFPFYISLLFILILILIKKLRTYVAIKDE